MVLAENVLKTHHSIIIDMAVSSNLAVAAVASDATGLAVAN